MNKDDLRALYDGLSGNATISQIENLLLKEFSKEDTFTDRLRYDA